MNPLKQELAKKPELIVKGFSESAFTILKGEVVAKKGKVVKTPHGKVMTLAPELGDDLAQRSEKEIAKMITNWYSHQFSNYSVPERYREPIEEKITLDARSVSA